MKKIITITLVGFSTFLAFAQSFDSKKMDSLFILLEKNNKFMGSIAISHNQKTIYDKTIGFSDVENGKKADKNTKYRIGSISKIFTAALIFKAIEDKKLKLNQTLSEFFPSIKNSKTITIENLLNHSSGIYDFTKDENYLEWNSTYQSKDKMIERIEKGENDFNPNEKNEYSNSNYVLLTFILEKIHKKSYSEILNNEIVQPLKLKNTFFGEKTNIAKNESYSYNFEGDWTKETDTDLSIPQGAGSIISTPTDLNSFLEHLFLGKIISEKSLKEMKTIKNGYGMGLFQFPYNEKVSFGHTGGIDGFHSAASYFPKEKLAISLTSNGVNYAQNNILLAALTNYFNDPYQLPTFKVIKVDASDLKPFLGIYSSKEIPLKITITNKDNTLFAQATGQSEFPLEATAQNTFVFEQAGIKLVFNSVDKTMTLFQGGKEFMFNME